MKMIAAVSKNWGIGKNGDLLFSIPADMKFFRETTKGSTVVMGRKTLDSFPGGNPLKNRVNIVLTNDKNFRRDGVIVCHTKDEILEKVKNNDNVFVIGGEAIYHMFLEDCSEAYITKVDATADADKFLDNLDLLPEWQIIEKSEIIEDNGYNIQFVKYVKK